MMARSATGPILQAASTPSNGGAGAPLPDTGSSRATNAPPLRPARDAATSPSANPHRGTTTRKPSDFDRLLETPGSEPADATANELPAPTRAETGPDDASSTRTQADAQPPTLPEQLLSLMATLASATPSAVPAPAASAQPGLPVGAAAVAAAGVAVPNLPATTTAGTPPGTLLQGVPQSVSLPAGLALPPLAQAAASDRSDPAPTTNSNAQALVAAAAGTDISTAARQLAGLGAVTAEHVLRAQHALEPGGVTGTDTATAPVFTMSTVPAVIHAAPLPPASPLLQPADAAAGYGEELGTRLVWMAEQRVGHADVQVTPEHLGPIEVRLQLDGARVHAAFYSAQPEVRQALEASLPRLRDMLGQHGLQLGHADVGQRRPDTAPQARGAAGNDGNDSTTGPDVRATTLSGRLVRGLLDEYA